MSAMLAADRESLFWINFLEVPPKPPDGGDLLKLTYRLRMKVLFRPSTLAGNARQAVAQLAWRVRRGTADVPGGFLEASNGTPYFITLTAVDLRLPNHALAQDSVTVAPFGHARMPLPAQASDLADGTMVHYTAVGDNGEAISGTSRIQP
ncbi:fimbrial biogenesis chaperone [Cupriavidus basilensis]|nr:fimbria/pilus periplasmic chaperone [Cupriavidus basilensis]